MIIRLAERELRTKFGTFTEILYYDGRSESIALIMGDVAAQSSVLCRIHSHCIGADILNSIECDCREDFAMSQFLIEQEGRGVIIWLDQEGRGNGHLALMKSMPFKKAGSNQSEAYVKAGFAPDARDYRDAVAILQDLKVISVVLLTNNREKAGDLSRGPVPVADTKRIEIAGDEMSGLFREKLLLSGRSH